MRLFLPLLIGACSSVPGPDSHSVSLELVNPTISNPFGGVSQLRLRILDGQDVVVEETINVDDPLEVPNIDLYGVLRFELAGLGEQGEVISYGRSSDIAVIPDLERSVALTFLPVNKVLTLGAEFLEPRSFHSTAKGPDGRVFLLGGINAAQTNSLSSIEYYEPETGRSIPLANFLSFAPILPSVTWTDDEQLMVHGGVSVTNGSPAWISSINLIDAATDGVSVLPSSGLGRRDHCFSAFDGQQSLAVGGTEGTSTSAELLVPSTSHPSGWMWQSLAVTNFQTYNIQSCATTSNGRIFLQGTGDQSTGVYTPDSSGTNGADFQTIDFQQSSLEYLVYPYGQMIVPLDERRVWMAGGRQNLDGDGDFNNDPPAGVSREFNLDTRVFSQGADPNLSERSWGHWDPWIEPNTYAVGCGGVDGNVEVNPNTLVEVFNLETQEVLLAVPLDRNRPGCNMNVLDDGSILISGGHAEGDEVTDGGAILVPYLD